MYLTMEKIWKGENKATLVLFLIRPEQTVGMKRNNEMCFGFDTSI